MIRVRDGLIAVVLGLGLTTPASAVTLVFDTDAGLVTSRSRVESEFAVFRPDVGDWGVRVWDAGWLVASGADRALVVDFIELMESVRMHGDLDHDLPG